jgi:hypothetical protein
MKISFNVYKRLEIEFSKTDVKFTGEKYQMMGKGSPSDHGL